MLSIMRHRFGIYVFGGVVTLIGFVFIFSGVFTPKGMGGRMGGTSFVGAVNGETISVEDFRRAYNQRLEFFKNLGGGLSEEQLKAFRVKESVFQELVQRKAIALEAQNQKFIPSKAELREYIMKVDAFKKNDQFDMLTYRKLLESNGMDPGRFEDKVREDLAVQSFTDFVRNRVRVTTEEARLNFISTNEKRKLKYVVISIEAGKKVAQVSNDDLQKFYKDEAKMNLLKSKFEAAKETAYKGKKLEDVQEQIAKDVILADRSEEIRKSNEAMADQVVTLMGIDAASDEKINALLKNMGIKVQVAESFTRANDQLPGVGESADLSKDVFAKASPLSLQTGGKAKKYLKPGKIIVAALIGVQSADMAEFEKKSSELKQSLQAKKERTFLQEWIKSLTAKAKVETNEQFFAN